MSFSNLQRVPRSNLEYQIRRVESGGRRTLKLCCQPLCDPSLHCATTTTTTPGLL